MIKIIKNFKHSKFIAIKNISKKYSNMDFFSDAVINFYSKKFENFGFGKFHHKF